MALRLSRLGRISFVSFAACTSGVGFFAACDAPVETLPGTTTSTDVATVVTVVTSTTTSMTDATTSAVGGAGGIGGAGGFGGAGGLGGAGGTAPSCANPAETSCSDVCVDTSTDLTHCGACDVACGVLDHATVACTLGVCEVGVCDAGFGNCDLNPVTGCEATLASDAQHCGMCDIACGTGKLCVSGVCQKPVVSSNIATGFEHSCVVLMDGTAKCWGDGVLGELGNAANLVKSTPVAVSNAMSLTAIGVGQSFGCARKSDGTLWCWGVNSHGGKLGIGVASESPINVPVQAMGLVGVDALGTGRFHACASTTAKEVYCWGTNAAGQLGDPALSSSNKPAKVPAGLPAERAISVAVGGFHTCAVFEGGDVYCWGRNDFGQVGDGTVVSPRKSPLKVTLPKMAEEVVAGDYFSCARLIDGSVSCWGNGLGGELGNSASANSSTPVQVTGVTTASRLGAGFAHACAVLADNTVTCWGSNSAKQLGNAAGNSNKPVAVAGLTGVVQVEGGDLHSCAFLLTGGVRCWGGNAKGQLGNNSMLTSSTPVTPVGLD